MVCAGRPALGRVFRALTCGEIKMLCPHFGRREFTSRRARSLNQIRLALHLSEFQFRWKCPCS